MARTNASNLSKTLHDERARKFAIGAQNSKKSPRKSLFFRNEQKNFSGYGKIYR
jgi:hypothetical protein